MERQRVHKRGQSEWGDKLLAPLELEHTTRKVVRCVTKQYGVVRFMSTCNKIDGARCIAHDPSGDLKA